tara:strand:+ start:1370 stop:2251 length:882 start_codon:yes stop_codon:yes gene_type:complete
MFTLKKMKPFIELLRWNKPSGRLILLIPAGWTLWLTPTAPPSWKLISLIFAGAVFTSGAGCIANDLWDKKIDRQVKRTKGRPLAIGSVNTSAAIYLLCLMLILSLAVVYALPIGSKILCLKLSALALVFILFYPSAKRWFKYPQAILSLCWGFSVLITWAASQSTLSFNIPLIGCWVATMLWTFGFDTVYAIVDKNDDEVLGLNSSVISLQGKVIGPVSISYGLTSLFLAWAAILAQVNWIFWPFWIASSIGMQREIWVLTNLNTSSNRYRNHFRNQVWLGGIILIGLIIGRI